MKNHNYSIRIIWKGNTGKGTADYHAYQRNFVLTVEGKPAVEGSSDPTFLGDENRHNPEELFIASLSSCHMLWYLHLCSSNGITVVSYRDEASGVMVTEKSGSGCFESVTLRPNVTILERGKKDLANELHHQANKMCFIANSCKVKIGHEPVTKIHTT